ncbi:MAG: ATP-binding protein [Comamonadaceae bacterium]|nr:ATP-binding protein [Comamonadaceae bacterium]
MGLRKGKWAREAEWEKRCQRERRGPAARRGSLSLGAFSRRVAPPPAPPDTPTDVRVLPRPAARAVLDRARPALPLHERARTARRWRTCSTACGGGGGFVLLTGEIGAGKTTVCRCFLEQMPAALRRRLHLQPASSTVAELLQTDLRRVPHRRARRRRARATVKDYVDALNDFLLRRARRRPQRGADHRRGAEPVAPTCWSSCGC